MTLTSFNTSHVKVNLLLSFHQLLLLPRFNTSHVKVNLEQLYHYRMDTVGFNTSHVKVNLHSALIMRHGKVFQYIPC